MFHNSKPATMDVREWLIKSLASESNLPQQIVAKVIKHQYESAYEAINKFNSIEIAGFGKFYYNVKKSQKFMEKFIMQKNYWEKMLCDESISERKRLSYKDRLASVEKNIKNLMERNESVQEYGK